MVAVSRTFAPVATAATRRALVVDDHEDICELTVTHLEQLGLAADSVASKVGLVHSLSADHPDILLLDLSLGDTDAVEVFGLLADLNYRGCVILMSGHAGAVLEHARRIGLRAGIEIAGVLRKPFRRHDLSGLLDNIAGTPDSGRPQKRVRREPGLLREAVANDWLEFWFQPKIELDGDLVVGAESLARVRHPERGVIGPGAFLPDAGEEELYALTIEAVRSALVAGRRLSRDGLAPRFSVNVPGRILKHGSLLGELKALRDADERAPTLILEITETDVIDDAVAGEEFATRAVLHGFDLSIDDFGTGYATFDRLRNIPFTELKLERSVVDGCADDKALWNICRAAVQLGHGFEATVVAEGVERAADLEALRTLGFDMAQGFLFAPSLTLDDLARYLAGRD